METTDEIPRYFKNNEMIIIFNKVTKIISLGPTNISIYTGDDTSEYLSGNNGVTFMTLYNQYIEGGLLQ